MSAWEPSIQSTGGLDLVQGGLTVRWQSKHIQASPRRIVFKGGVTATYDKTEIRSDQLTLDLEGDQGVGTAEGGVLITDPDGTMRASVVVFDWKKGTGTATNVDGLIHRFRLKAKVVELDPKVITLRDAQFGSEYERPGLFEVRAKSLEVTPGKGGIARNAELRIFNQKILSVQRYSFSLQKRAAGLRLPSISYGRDGAFGASWNGDFLLSRQTAVGFGIQAFPGNPLGAAFLLSQRLDRGALVGVQSSFDERRSNSFFEDVRVENHFSAWENSAQALNLTVGTALNQSPSARRTFELYTIPYDIALQKGLSLGTARATAQIRAQQVRVEGGQYNRRSAGGLTVLPKPVQVGSVSLVSRLDSNAFLQAGRDYGWIQGEVGLVWESSSFRIGSAVSLAKEFGRPAFAMDQLYTNRSVAFRLDLLKAPTRLSLLAKLDLETQKWFDHELRLRQVAGSLEPFVVWRRFPSSFSFGVRLRIDEIFDSFARRSSERPK